MDHVASDADRHRCKLSRRSRAVDRQYPDADSLGLGLDGRGRCQALDRIALVYVLLFRRKCHFDHVCHPDRYKHCSNPRARSYEEKGGGGNQTAWRLARVGLCGVPGCSLYWSVE